MNQQSQDSERPEDLPAALELGALLRGLREARGWSLRKAARKLKYHSHSQLSAFEAGKEILPLRRVAIVAKVLGANADELETLRRRAQAEKEQRWHAEKVEEAESSPDNPGLGRGQLDDTGRVGKRIWLRVTLVASASMAIFAFGGAVSLQIRTLGAGSHRCIPIGTAGGEYASEFRAAYDRFGGAAVLGCAINEVHTWGPGMTQDLRGGSERAAALMATVPESAIVLAGQLWRAYDGMGGVGTGRTAPLAGYPRSDPQQYREGFLLPLTQGSGGDGGLLRRNGDPNWYWVSGPMWDRYASEGGPSGWLGFPIGPSVASGSQLRQAFEGGILEV